MEKVDNMWEQMGNVSTEMDPQKETKGNTRNQKQLQKNAFDGLIIRLSKAKKESVSFKTDQQKLSKASKEKKERKKQNRVTKDCGETTKGITYA